ncbi:MAG: sugar phosphate isomerase/epimerase [Candidatus Bathyarchaeia archaeon]
MYLGYWVTTPLIGKEGKLFADTTRLREELSFASKSEFECVRLSYADSPRGAAPKLDETGVAEVKRLLQEHNLFVENITSGGNHLDPDPEARRRWNTLLKETVDVCRLFDVKVVATDVGSPADIYIYGLPGLFGPGTTMRGPPPRMGPRGSKVDLAIEMYKEAIGPIAEHAESVGVKVAFENNFRAMAGNISQAPYIWDRMFEAVPSKATGLRIDPSHFICLMISPVESIIRRYGERVYAIDGKDCEVIPEMLQAQGIYGNLWWRYRIPGYGDLNWRKVISALMDIGYKGGIIIENEDPNFPGREGILLGAQYLRPLLPRQE